MRQAERRCPEVRAHDYYNCTASNHDRAGDDHDHEAAGHDDHDGPSDHDDDHDASATAAVRDDADP